VKKKRGGGLNGFLATIRPTREGVADISLSSKTWHLLGKWRKGVKGGVHLLY